MSSKYNLFLFDLDDTLLDFKASEKLSLFRALEHLKLETGIFEQLYKDYQQINAQLWRQFEKGLISKDDLKVQRFYQTFTELGIDHNPVQASNDFLEALPETVVLMPYATEILEWVSRFGEIGILTNGISDVQNKRIKKSNLSDYISFISVSEECGHAKPDRRFFEHSVQKATSFSKEKSLMIGDRFEADIVGAHIFEMDSCWFNPEQNKPAPEFANIAANFEIQHLEQLKKLI